MLEDEDALGRRSSEKRWRITLHDKFNNSKKGETIHSDSKQCYPLSPLTGWQFMFSFFRPMLACARKSVETENMTVHTTTLICPYRTIVYKYLATSRAHLLATTTGKTIKSRHCPQQPIWLHSCRDCSQTSAARSCSNICSDSSSLQCWTLSILRLLLRSTIESILIAWFRQTEGRAGKKYGFVCLCLLCDWILYFFYDDDDDRVSLKGMISLLNGRLFKWNARILWRRYIVANHKNNIKDQCFSNNQPRRRSQDWGRQEMLIISGRNECTQNGSTLKYKI